MHLQLAANAITGAILGALLALVLSLVVVAAAGPEGSGLSVLVPALITCAGAIAGGLIGLFNP